MSTLRSSSIRAGLVFGLVFGVFLYIFNTPLFAIIVAPLSGAFFSVALYFFLSNKEVSKQTEFQNVYGETVLYSAPANHFMGWEAVGGKLYLLKDRLEFQSHSLNIQNHQTIIPVKNIKEAILFSYLGFIPNGLMIVTKEGQKEKFVVSGRKKRKEKIEQLMS